MGKEEAIKLIEALLSEAKASLDKAASIADKAGVTFYWSGPEYGTGATYVCGAEADDWRDAGWNPSSMSC